MLLHAVDIIPGFHHSHVVRGTNLSSEYPKSLATRRGNPPVVTPVRISIVVMCWDGGIKARRNNADNVLV